MKVTRFAFALVIAALSLAACGGTEDEPTADDQSSITSVCVTCIDVQDGIVIADTGGSTTETYATASCPENDVARCTATCDGRKCHSSKAGGTAGSGTCEYCYCSDCDDGLGGRTIKLPLIPPTKR